MRLHMQADQTLPGVTVILPVKGCRKHSVSNWASHVRLRYAGPVEFLFVVDSQVGCHTVETQLCSLMIVALIDLHMKRGCGQKFEPANALQDDPAHSHLIKLAAELSSGGSAVRIVVAPAAKTCSQKIANLQAGIEVSTLLTPAVSPNMSLFSALYECLMPESMEMSREYMQGASAEHQWVLCVDDDVLLYEAFLEDLIRSMQQRPSFFMATG